MDRLICYDCYQIQKQKRETGDWLNCVNCGTTFLFSLGEQEFYRKKGYQPPKRCAECRQLKRESLSRSTPTVIETDWVDELYDGLKSIWEILKN